MTAFTAFDVAVAVAAKWVSELTSCSLGSSRFGSNQGKSSCSSSAVLAVMMMTAAAAQEEENCKRGERERESATGKDWWGLDCLVNDRQHRPRSLWRAFKRRVMVRGSLRYNPPPPPHPPLGCTITHSLTHALQNTIQLAHTPKTDRTDKTDTVLNTRPVASPLNLRPTSLSPSLSLSLSFLVSFTQVALSSVVFLCTCISWTRLSSAV